MRARSALFDIYGGHLRPRGGVATVAALVRLLRPLEFGAPAVRTAVSRTVRQGWLQPHRLAGGPGYALTPRGRSRLDEAATRVYRTASSTWDGRWHVVLLGRPPARQQSVRVGSSLRLLGYGCLGGQTWIAPRPAPGLTDLLAAEDLPTSRFHGPHDGDDATLAARAWPLDDLAAAYRAFHRSWQTRLAGSDPGEGPDAFAESLRLLHEWRKFLFHDPGLPAELLPPDWAGAAAAEFFDAQTARLAPAAADFVDHCLAADAPATTSPGQ